MFCAHIKWCTLRNKHGLSSKKVYIYLVDLDFEIWKKYVISDIITIDSSRNSNQFQWFQIKFNDVFVHTKRFSTSAPTKKQRKNSIASAYCTANIKIYMKAPSSKCIMCISPNFYSLLRSFLLTSSSSFFMVNVDVFYHWIVILGRMP